MSAASFLLTPYFLLLLTIFKYEISEFILSMSSKYHHRSSGAW